MLLCIGFQSEALAQKANVQQLKVGTKEANKNNVVELPIFLSSNGNVAAAQLDIVYDTQALELLDIKKGSGLSDAFLVQSNLYNGRVIFGNLGGEVVPAGQMEVIVALFKIKESAAVKEYAIDLQGVVFSDIEAQEITQQFSVSNGKIIVQAPMTDYENLPFKSNVELYKNWLVRFNDKVKESTIHASTIYVTDRDGTIVKRKY